MLRTMTVTVTDVDKNGQSISVVVQQLAIQPACRGSESLDKIKVGDQIDITWDTNVTLAAQ